jgi:hypothetical protein
VPTFPDLARHQQETNREPLTLPVNGKDYVFPATLPLRTGITITRLREEVTAYTLASLAGLKPNPNAELLDDASESKLILDLIGPEKLAQLDADGLMWDDIQRVGKTLIAWHMYSEDTALSVWKGGVNDDPPALSSSSKPRRTSRSGSTTSKPRSSKAAPRKAPRRKSGGETSSPAGT